MAGQLAAEPIKTGAISAHKAFDLLLLAAVGVFFVGYVNIHSELLGIPHFLPTSEGVEQYWEVFSWLIFGMLAFDVYVKYRKVGNAKYFLKKHWLEIAMLALIPIFAGLKIAKLSINVVKAMKMSKSGFKVAHGAKKMSQPSDASESL